MWIKALILGIIQGFAEFLPISSSGHLVLASEILQINAPGNVMEVMLHLGTLGSVFVCFWDKIKMLIIDFFSLFIRKRSRVRSEAANYKNLSLYLILASIPAVVTGLFLDSYFQELFDKVIYTGVALLFTAGVLWFADYYSKGRKKLNKIKAKDAFIIGLWQSIAVFPGISRAGMTIFGGLKRGLKKNLL
ncbi:undecaprenyl-diphosphate phosphatase [Clostridium sp. 'deep sea']|uniref:undecaprenyl-diphosphate phosphatase n=1 Tax=Clostridium sp. 'deep sea' TaxID=2779445 RepID=UPI0018968104|nr:undecaprenyl-diphosphate phosphatase [Clostridium sp. 'deep sea']QOR35798.1 undecaprenyl-diphosphate phosphatase [Clostridium sp. 'deep sea']